MVVVATYAPALTVAGVEALLGACGAAAALQNQKHHSRAISSLCESYIGKPIGRRAVPQSRNPVKIGECCGCLSLGKRGGGFLGP